MAKPAAAARRLRPACPRHAGPDPPPAAQAQTRARRSQALRTEVEAAIDPAHPCQPRHAGPDVSAAQTKRSARTMATPRSRGRSGSARPRPHWQPGSRRRSNDVSHADAAVPGEVRRWRAFSLLAVMYLMTAHRTDCRARHVPAHPTHRTGPRRRGRPATAGPGARFHRLISVHADL